MAGAAGPHDVVEQLLGRISNQDWAGLAELYAEDAVVEYPFALPGPRRLEGRPAIRRYFESVSRLPLQLRARDISVHRTRDPEVVVVEYGYDALATSTGRSFRLANIQVTTVRDGLIVNSRDYHNHVAMADAVGRLDDLVAAIDDHADQADPGFGESTG
jgi:ketosteroid isomerase-like protein